MLRLFMAALIAASTVVSSAHGQFNSAVNSSFGSAAGFAVPSASLPGTVRNYVAIGDSITYGQFASPLTDGYAYLIASDNNLLADKSRHP